MPNRRHRRDQPISRLFPNMITLAGMCCGLSSLRFALDARWELSLALVLAAAIIDGMDGRVARMLGATSTFGAQLDSLSDFVCFGIVPAMIMYMWVLHEIRGVGWAVALFFAICAALRLARFNTGLLEPPKHDWERAFFVGVPSPAGGVICMLPLVIAAPLGTDLSIPPLLVAVYVAIIGTLMVSKIPTFGGKNLKIPHDHIMPFMIGGGLMIVLLIIELWAMVAALSIAYLASIYLSYRQFQTLKARHGDGHSDPE